MSYTKNKQNDFGKNLTIIIVLIISAMAIFGKPVPQDKIEVTGLEINSYSEVDTSILDDITKDQIAFEEEAYKENNSITIEKVKEIKSKVVRENHPNASTWIDYQEWDQHVFDVITDCQERGLIKDQCSYILATMQHETASFTTYEEFEGSWELSRRGCYSWSGDTNHKYHGSGYIQLTCKKNYEKWSNILGVDIVSNPQLMRTDHNLMRRVLMEFMLSKGLTNYITPDNVDFINARRTVNGLDKAHLVARYATAWAVELEGLY